MNNRNTPRYPAQELDTVGVFSIFSTSGIGMNYHPLFTSKIRLYASPCFSSKNQEVRHPFFTSMNIGKAPVTRNATPDF
jgi:hypothetical protein